MASSADAVVDRAGEPEPGNYDALAAQRGRLERTSRSARVADIVRDGILAGQFRPGTRLSEPDICAALQVSRNTLREAFRTLIEERLVVHQLNRGVFVRIPSSGDVAEVYKCRRIVECAAVRDQPRTGASLVPLAEILSRADRLAAQGDWTGVGTEDVNFHRAITALGDSVLLNHLMTNVWNELRLIFHVVSDPDAFHRPYLDRNHAVFDELSGGAPDIAAGMLTEYLAVAEAQIREAYAARGLGA